MARSAWCGIGQLPRGQAAAEKVQTLLSPKRPTLWDQQSTRMLHKSSALIGGSGADTLSGGTADDILLGRGGYTLDGSGGNDIIFGGENDDTLTGGTGVDYIDGGAGIDTIYSGTDVAAEDIENDAILRVQLR